MVTENLFTFQAHLLVLYNAAFQIMGWFLCRLSPRIYHCPLIPPRICKTLPQVPSSTTTTAHINPVSGRTQKVVRSPHREMLNIFLRGLKKHIHFTSSFGGLPAGKKTTQPIEKKSAFRYIFAPVLKKQGKLCILWAVNCNSCFLLIPFVLFVTY